MEMNPKKMRCEDEEIEIALDGQPKRPTTTCMQSPKRTDIDASPQLPISTGIQSLDRSRLPWSIPLDRSRSPRSAIKSRVLMHAYATRGLGFLVRCATISRQLGQGRLRSRGSPLFMINHRSSYHYVVCPLRKSVEVARIATVPL